MKTVRSHCDVSKKLNAGRCAAPRILLHCQTPKTCHHYHQFRASGSSQLEEPAPWGWNFGESVTQRVSVTWRRKNTKYMYMSLWRNIHIKMQYIILKKYNVTDNNIMWNNTEGERERERKKKKKKKNTKREWECEWCKLSTGSNKILHPNFWLSSARYWNAGMETSKGEFEIIVYGCLWMSRYAHSICFSCRLISFCHDGSLEKTSHGNLQYIISLHDSKDSVDKKMHLLLAKHKLLVGRKMQRYAKICKNALVCLKQFETVWVQQDVSVKVCALTTDLSRLWGAELPIHLQSQQQLQPQRSWAVAGKTGQQNFGTERTSL